MIWGLVPFTEKEKIVKKKNRKEKERNKCRNSPFRTLSLIVLGIQIWNCSGNKKYGSRTKTNIYSWARDTDLIIIRIAEII